MSASIGAVCNVYQEANALPGWLENVTQWADDVRVYHAGPGGKLSTDGTMEILEKWKIPYTIGKIDDGFGVVRTAAARYSPCDWVFILDADERFHATAIELSCTGGGTPDDEVHRALTAYDTESRSKRASGTGDGRWQSWEGVKSLGSGLSVDFGNSYNQAAWVRSYLEVHTTANAYTMIRRHWHDFSWRRPTQNWHVFPDYQNRLIRNVDGVYFEPSVKMHEQLVGASNRIRPNQMHGPFIDHYHFTFKGMEPEQRAQDIAIYDALHFGREVPTE